MMRCYSRTVLSLSLAFLILFSSVTFAETDGVNYYDMGRAYTSMWVDDSSPYYRDAGTSFMVISVGANYDRTLGTGYERIRIWSRSPQVEAYLNNTISHSAPVIAKPVVFYARFMRDDAPRNVQEFSIDTNWPSAIGAGTTIPGLIFNLLGFPGSSLLEAWANNLYTQGILVSKNDANYDWTVTWRNYSGYDKAVADLPPNIPYYEADGGVAGSYSGISTKFKYTFPPQVTNVGVWPQAQMTYSVDNGYSIFNVYSGAAGIQHKVNRQ
ncbi:MAG: hypothetical protein ACM3ZQ_01720 [Bacillota bacterium]